VYPSACFDLSPCFDLRVSSGHSCVVNVLVITGLEYIFILTERHGTLSTGVGLQMLIEEIRVAVP